jgi:hypothetical protein
MKAGKFRKLKLLAIEIYRKRYALKHLKKIRGQNFLFSNILSLKSICKNRYEEIVYHVNSF